MTTPIENTCGSCNHWHEMPRDATNLKAPRMGQCRAVPPTPVIVGLAQTVHGPVPQIDSIYPALVANAPACGIFKEKLLAIGKKVEA